MWVYLNPRKRWRTRANCDCINWNRSMWCCRPVHQYPDDWTRQWKRYLGPYLWILSFYVCWVRGKTWWWILYAFMRSTYFSGSRETFQGTRIWQKHSLFDTSKRQRKILESHWYNGLRGFFFAEYEDCGIGDDSEQSGRILLYHFNH